MSAWNRIWIIPAVSAYSIAMAALFKAGGKSDRQREKYWNKR